MSDDNNGWRDISTATKVPHERVLLWSPDAEYDNPFIGYWSDNPEFLDGGAWYEGGDHGGFPVDADPTYWQPLPADPKVSA